MGLGVPEGMKRRGGGFWFLLLSASIRGSLACLHNIPQTFEAISGLFVPCYLTPYVGSMRVPLSTNGKVWYRHVTSSAVLYLLVLGTLYASTCLVKKSKLKVPRSFRADVISTCPSAPFSITAVDNSFSTEYSQASGLSIIPTRGPVHALQPGRTLPLVWGPSYHLRLCRWL